MITHSMTCLGHRVEVESDNGDIRIRIVDEDDRRTIIRIVPTHHHRFDVRGQKIEANPIPEEEAI